jgi:hypothetical protein
LKRRRKNNFILVQNGKTDKFVPKEAFRIPYFEFTTRKRVTCIHCIYLFVFRLRVEWMTWKSGVPDKSNKRPIN